MGKIAVSVAAIAYAIGVLLVSSDLAQYRVSNFSLAQAQYVLAGAVWLVTTVVVLGLSYSGAYLTLRGRFKSNSGRICFVFFWICSCVLLLALMFHKILMTSISFWSIARYTVLPETMFFLAALVGFAKNAFHDKEENPLDSTLRAILLYAGVFIVWILAYNRQLFPYIDPSLGGGKHPKAHVVFQPEKGQESQLQYMLGPVPLENLSTRDSVTVVLVDADFVVLAFEVVEEKPPFWKTFLLNPERTQQYKSVHIKKSLVASIMYD